VIAMHREETPSGLLRLAAANLNQGGLDHGGGDERWHLAVDALAARSAHLACVQEMSAQRDPYALSRHLWRTAETLGMHAILGPPGGISGNHTAILVNIGRLAIVEAGPVPRPHGDDPAWCEALLRDRIFGTVFRVYSVHLPARSVTQQLIHAETLANTIAQRGELAFALGDFNAYAPWDHYTPEALAAQPRHLRSVRMLTGPGGQLAVNPAVHDALASVGLMDVAAALITNPLDRRPTGKNSGGTPDKALATKEALPSAEGYDQFDNPGSDHEAFMITVNGPVLAAATPPGTRA
jgi:hypothetical protein